MSSRKNNVRIPVINVEDDTVTSIENMAVVWEYEQETKEGICQVTILAPIDGRFKAPKITCTNK